MVALPKTETDQNGFFHLKENTEKEEVSIGGPC